MAPSFPDRSCPNVKFWKRPRLCENSSRKQRRRSQTSQICAVFDFLDQGKGSRTPEKLIFGVFTQLRPNSDIQGHFATLAFSKREILVTVRRPY